MSQTKVCFFITPIGSSDSPERIRSDHVLKRILRPALEPEFEVIRADEEPSPTIFKAIIKRLLQSELVVVDLSDNNANVYYELGVRHCTNLPVIALNELGKNPAFDLHDTRYIAYSVDTVDQRQYIHLIKKRIEWLEQNQAEHCSTLMQLGIMSPARYKSGDDI